MRGGCACGSLPITPLPERAPHRAYGRQLHEGIPSSHSQPRPRMPAMCTRRQHATSPASAPPTITYAPRGMSSLDCESGDRRSCPQPFAPRRSFTSGFGLPLVLARFPLSRCVIAAAAAVPGCTISPPRERNARVRPCSTALR